jgi:MFS family permease
MNPVDGVALGRGPRRLFRIGLSSQVLTVLCLMYLVMYIDRVNIATVAPRMTADLGLNNTQFGLAISAFSYPYALFQLIGGWVSDRFGPRRALMLSGLVVCVATACTGCPLGIRARHYPFCVPAWKRADAAAHRGIDGLYLLAWLVRGAGTCGPGLGRPLVVALSR